MTNPVAGDENRQLDMQFDFAHFKRRSVAVPHQIIDKPFDLRSLLCSAAVRHARRLNDCRVVAHIVDDADESVIQNRERFVKNILQRGNGRALCLIRRGSSISRCWSAVSSIMSKLRKGTSQQFRTPVAWTQLFNASAQLPAHDFVRLRQKLCFLCFSAK